MTFAITASVVVAVGTTAYNSRQARKAQEKQERSNLIRRMTIEGQAPELLDVGQEVVGQPIMGSDISEALQQLRYDPNAGFMEMLQTQQMPAEQEIPPEILEQLMMEQQAQYAHGGPVGFPEDTYYFDVEDIQAMMAEADPMMQNVGAGLMAQMGPGMGAVPATPSQLQMMAEGGLVGNQDEIDKNNNGRIDAQDFEILRRQEGGDLDPDYLEEIPIDLDSIIEEIPIDLDSIIEEIPFNVNILTTEAKDVGPEYDEVIMLNKGDGEELVEGRDYFVGPNGEFLWPWEVEEYLRKSPGRTKKNAKMRDDYLDSLMDERAMLAKKRGRRYKKRP